MSREYVVNSNFSIICDFIYCMSVRVSDINTNYNNFLKGFKRLLYNSSAERPSDITLVFFEIDMSILLLRIIYNKKTHECVYFGQVE